MPTKTISVGPELFLVHKGARIYHTYKDDNMDNAPSNFYFTTTFDYEGSNGDESSFDVRELDVPARQQLDAAGQRTHAVRAIIREALDLGLIEIPDGTPTNSTLLQYTVNEIHSAEYIVDLTPEQAAEFEALTTDAERVEFTNRVHENARCLEETVSYEAIMDDSFCDFRFPGTDD